MILYFSATGNSKHVAIRLAEAIDDKAVSIEGLSPEVTVAGSECLGFVFPTAWWELPVMPRKFLGEIKLTGNPSYVFLVSTYGTTPGAIASDAAHLLRRRGIRLDAAFGVKMPDTWTPMFDLSDKEKVAGINDAADKEIDAIIPRIEARETGTHLSHRMPYAVRLFTDHLLDMERHTVHFHLEDSCVGCGLCARNCPVNAIEIKDRRAVWTKDMCALCFRCLHSCPKFAIQYGRSTKAHGQYLHPSFREKR